MQVGKGTMLLDLMRVINLDSINVLLLNSQLILKTILKIIYLVIKLYFFLLAICCITLAYFTQHRCDAFFGCCENAEFIYHSAAAILEALDVNFLRFIQSSNHFRKR